MYRGAGRTLVGSGVAISASAVRSAPDVDLEQPSTLFSSGLYTTSRNSMYVGWTLLYLGGAPVTRNAWMVASLPLVGGIIHREVLREERTPEKSTVGTGSWFADTLSVVTETSKRRSARRRGAFRK